MRDEKGRFIKGNKCGFAKGHKNNIGQTPWNKGIVGYLSGKNNPNWRGGITPFIKKVRSSRKYKKWSFEVKTRDRFTCVECGNNSKKELQADHIIPFCKILNDNNILTYSDAIKCEELWNINNGRTLYIRCHKKTSTFGINFKYYK